MRLRNLLLTALAASSAAWPAVAQILDEYQVKAAFVLNFVAATEWPTGGDRPLTLCIAGQAPYETMARALDGKRAAGRSLVTRVLRGREQPAGCDAVFITRDQAGAAARILDEIGTAPVLTVAETPGMAERGVMINLLLVRDQIAFEVSQSTVRRTPLALSSKLLRLAVAVY